MENNTDQKIINGNRIAGQLFADLKQRVNQLPFQPILCDVVVGDDPVSLSYVKIKEKKAKACGLEFSLVDLPETATETEVVAAIQTEQQKDNLCGLIVQLPLPDDLDAGRVLAAIDPQVDVDLIGSGTNLVPPTAGAIMHILDSLPIDLSKEKILLLGQGNLVGKPVGKELAKRGLSFETATQTTPNTTELLRQATLIVCGIAQPKMLTGDMVADGVIVIDAGTSESGGSIVGDVDFDSLLSKARFLTPTPGGVGPVTVAKLLENVVIVAETKSV
jgi:methylenetetrahydrofolate dehydrogenase (NADP+) / methenyltetrahydrofolate cyclohydrolase